MAGDLGNIDAYGSGPAPRPAPSMGHYDFPPTRVPKLAVGLGGRTLAAIAGYIDTHMDHSIGVADLAGLANVSQFHFCRLFRRSTGLSPMGFLERARLQRAQDLIRDGELPLAEIAVTVGFADQSHFTRRFHRQVGCTPAAFAREHCIRRLPRRPR